jgi:hypothetical protein
VLRFEFICPTPGLAHTLIAMTPLQRKKALMKIWILTQGDFFHRREIDLVYAQFIKEELANWDIPTIAISGNHDQHSADGIRENSLYLLESFAPHWQMVVEPTIALGVAWIPYRYWYPAEPASRSSAENAPAAITVTLQVQHIPGGRVLPSSSQ